MTLHATWIELNLNFGFLDLIELNGIWVELNGIWVELSWVELNGIWVELNWIELNSNSCKFKSTIWLRFIWFEFKFNYKREMECKLVEKALKIYSWIWHWKAKTLKEHKFEERSFNAFSFWNGLNKFQFGIVHMMTTTYETTKFSYLINQVQWIIIIAAISYIIIFLYFSHSKNQT